MFNNSYQCIISLIHKGHWQIWFPYNYNPGKEKKIFLIIVKFHYSQTKYILQITGLVSSSVGGKQKPDMKCQNKIFRFNFSFILNFLWRLYVDPVASGEGNPPKCVPGAQRPPQQFGSLLSERLLLHGEKQFLIG